MLAGDAEPGTAVERGLLTHSRVARIRFVGVFDTVGSLGVPGVVGALSAQRYAFHNTDLSGLVDHARHAIALDERRASFVPTLWTAVPVPGPGPSTTVEQRWFVGSHGNAGGGNLASGDNRLSVISRERMAGEARAAGLTITSERVSDGGAIEPSASDGFFGAVAFLPGQRPRPRPVRETNLGETLDPSVLDRWTGDPDHRSPRRAVGAGLREWVRSLLGVRAAPAPPAGVR